MKREQLDGTRSVPICVVGAGPVGLTASLVLARAGIEVLLLEAESSLVEDLRTTIIHPSSLETWSLLKAADGFIDYGTRCNVMQFREREGRVIANLSYDCLAGETAFPHILLCALPFVVPNLYRHLVATGRASVAFGHRVQAARLTDSGVTLSVSSPSGPVDVQARYVIAADGTRSVIRDSFSIDRQRIAPSTRLFRITVDDPIDAYLPDVHKFSYVMDPVCFGLILRNPDFWRVPIGLARERAGFMEEAYGDADGRQLIQQYLFPDRPLKVTAARALTVTNWIATEFGIGPILFAGDSAHAINPMAGMGMNSGVLDAVEAAMAVAEALDSGQEGPRWAQYVYGRPRVARDIAVRALNRYHMLTEDDPERRARRNRWLETVAADERQRRRCLRDYSLLDRFAELKSGLVQMVEGTDRRSVALRQPVH